MGPKKRSSSGDPSDSESSPAKRPSLGAGPSSTKPPSTGASPSSSKRPSLTKTRSSPEYRRSRKHPSSSNYGLFPESPSQRGQPSLNGSAGPSLNGSAAPSAINVNPSRTFLPAARGDSSCRTATSRLGHSVLQSRNEAAREPQLGDSTIPPAFNTPSISGGTTIGPSLIGFTAIRQGNCYPAFLTRGLDQPPTPPTSLTSSLDVEVGNDDTPTLSSNTDVAAYEPPVPWDPDEDLHGVGGGLGFDPSQSAHDDDSTM